MKYKTAAAFRHALEERLRQQSLSAGAPLARLRKMVAFDRFLARLTKKQPDAWIVKGGFALQLRLGERARTTKDIDVSALNLWTREQTITHLRAAVLLNLGDWFEFEVGQPAEAATGAPERGFRFPIRCLRLSSAAAQGRLAFLRPVPSVREKFRCGGEWDADAGRHIW